MKSGLLITCLALCKSGRKTYEKKHKGWILILTGLFIFSLQACTDKSRNNVNFNEVAAENSVSPETEASSQILEDCVYATTGDMTGAAIGRDGSLYTWGLNIFGECGAEVTSDDFLRTPKKALENVRMVWPKRFSLTAWRKRFHRWQITKPPTALIHSHY